MLRATFFIFLLLCPTEIVAQGDPEPGSLEQRLERLYYAGELQRGMALVDSALSRQGQEGTASSAETKRRIRFLVAKGRLSATDAFVGHRSLDDAIETLRRAVDLASNFPGSPEQADALVELGFAEYVRAFLTGGDFAPIGDRFARALEIARTLKDTAREARSLFHAGLIDERLGHREEAMLSYLKSLALADTCGCRLVQSYAQRHIGFLLFNQPELALRHFRRSLELRQEIGFIVYMPFSLSALADTERRAGDPATAEPYAKRAVKVASSLQAPRSLVVSLLSLAEVKLALGEEGAARRRFAEARDLAVQIGYHDGEQAAREGISRVQSDVLR
jgi:tetratricopeptide (TPR) repeat protein